MKSLATLALFTTLTAVAQDPTMPPAGAQARHTVTGVGVQIYACTADGTWVLQEPRAKLIDARTGRQVGTHSKGPTWTWNDGSALRGKVVQQRPSADSIPWLLLSVQSTGARGVLSDMAIVRRSDTKGGKVPTTAACGAQNLGATLQVPYEATYTFYTAN